MKNISIMNNMNICQGSIKKPSLIIKKYRNNHVSFPDKLRPRPSFRRPLGIRWGWRWPWWAYGCIIKHIANLQYHRIPWMCINIMMYLNLLPLTYPPVISYITLWKNSMLLMGKLTTYRWPFPVRYVSHYQSAHPIHIPIQISIKCHRIIFNSYVTLW